ncbi:MAG TPA: hypothetical protein PKA63_06670 [Oligoflexia bacterium]|nr:hypothetical protein [Oligoflexia bacterium]HMP48333.1 hypothetical protein [Oligoflexia bacterium]
MGYNLGKRLSDLRKQTDETLEGRWGVKRFSFLVFIALIFARYTILPLTDLSSLNNDGTDPQAQEVLFDPWVLEIQQTIQSRIVWLESSPLVLFPGTSIMYQNLAQSMDSAFTLVEEEKELSSSGTAPDFNVFIQFSDIPLWFNRMVVGFILRLAFVLAFWPLWILGILAGVFLIRMQNNKAKSKTLLGVCDRGNGPFYSGIYGPYRPNNSFSGTDLSCPGLACPPMASREETEKMALVGLLERYGAKNDTNIELLQVVYAHANFPHYVGAESSIQAEEVLGPTDDDQRVSQTGLVGTEKGILLAGVMEALPSVLEAHAVARRYVSSLKNQNLDTRALNENFPGHVKAMEKLIEPLGEVSKILLSSLTPDRLWALADIPPSIVASAYLAIEAGKSLVYKPHVSGYSRISLYPHLQARAVIHSLVPYHQEYDGDSRLLIRQAIISSRRHGDFGRAFLPIRMPAKSRALRDWLEILYAENEKKQEVASLVELDAHIEEVHINFRSRLTQKIRGGAKDKSQSEKNHQLSKGLAYKSVVMLPLEGLVKLAISGFHKQRLRKIAVLLDVTRKNQTQITTSARLPGFKRQAMEADTSAEDKDLIVKKIKELPGGGEIYDVWRIVRRMLTKYNWLSTRVGDDSVPLVGVVHGILRKVDKDHRTKHLFMDALVPLRQRRFTEILGKHWENTYYRYAPYQDDIDVFTSTEEYDNQLRMFKAEPAPEEIENPDKERAAG